MENNKSYKHVFMVEKSGDGERTFWTKVGVAFVNKDNSLTVELNAIPLSGRLQIREPKQKQE
ncbi:MAG TPA: hypothetical protein VII00_09490 [bacterium]